MSQSLKGFFRPAPPEERYLPPKPLTGDFTDEETKNRRVDVWKSQHRNKSAMSSGDEGDDVASEDRDVDTPPPKKTKRTEEKSTTSRKRLDMSSQPDTPTQGTPYQLQRMPSSHYPSPSSSSSTSSGSTSSSCSTPRLSSSSTTPNRSATSDLEPKKKKSKTQQRQQGVVR